MPLKLFFLKKSTLILLRRIHFFFYIVVKFTIQALSVNLNCIKCVDNVLQPPPLSISESFSSPRTLYLLNSSVPFSLLLAAGNLYFTFRI